MTPAPQSSEFGAWNPGLDSELPRAYWPLSTLFRSENVSTSVAKALELSDYCGLPVEDLVAFRADRLIVHELLIGVTTNLSVPDGTKYRDLGENFRAMASTVLDRYIAPHRPELMAAFEGVKRNASAIVERELVLALAPASDDAGGAEVAGGWFKRVKAKKPPQFAEQAAEERERRIVSHWREKSETADNRLEQACFQALCRIAVAVMGRQGRLFGNKELLTELAVMLVCNDYGSEIIGEAIEPYIRDAATGEGYRLLPAQKNTVVMNVKGASAAGKSTMRPRQRVLANKLNLPWEDFALISPDIWRKFLLDYGSLGDAYKYAGTMTGHEIEIIDKKLDMRMAAKAAKGEMPHLLIDRFRFDSFVSVPEGKGPTRLLTRFGDLVYMFFMITPPEMTVERAWKRGLKVGRYKAVEDLLAHNVEAFTGMPELFFTWALNVGKRVHYEFLDNSVAEGEAPRTVAFGWNEEMTILDIKSMLDIERFRKINIRAKQAPDVYAEENLAPECNLDFLKRCARLIPAVNFADYDTGQVYARMERGAWVWRDRQRFAQALADPDAKAGLAAIAADDDRSKASPRSQRIDLDEAKVHTLGAWGEAAPSG